MATLGEPSATWLLVVMISMLIQLFWGILGIVATTALLFPRPYKWLAALPKKLKGTVGDTYRRLLENRTVKSVISAFGYGYDKKQDIFYSRKDAWQRKYGYCRLYDEASALAGMILDSEPVTFDYNGKRWLIEFWKGQYDLATGFEIGVYNTDRPDIEVPGVFTGAFYESAGNDELLGLYCGLYKDNVKLFEREDTQWWLTGFKLGEFSNPSELAMDIRITFFDEDMRAAFAGGLTKAGYQVWDFDAFGNTVSFVFAKPRSLQPFTRTPEIEAVTQWKNKFLCDAFDDLTKNQGSVPLKVNRLKRQRSELYDRLGELGKSKRTLDAFRTLKAYLK